MQPLCSGRDQQCGFPQVQNFLQIDKKQVKMPSYLLGKNQSPTRLHQQQRRAVRGVRSDAQRHKKARSMPDIDPVDAKRHHYLDSRMTAQLRAESVGWLAVLARSRWFAEVGTNARGRGGV